MLAYSKRMLNVSPELEREEKQTAIDNDRQATERFNRAMSEGMKSLDKDENTAQNKDQPQLLV